jgi:hypothetical protein
MYKIISLFGSVYRANFFKKAVLFLQKMNIMPVSLKVDLNILSLFTNKRYYY